MKSSADKIAWICEQHSNTNHFYDTYLPYKFHLTMVAQAGADFMYIIERMAAAETSPGYICSSVEYALWGHDLIEDTRNSFNDVKDELGELAAELIYACTNEKGKNRKERACARYYDGIRNCKYASFVKLADRIANVQFSKLTKSDKFEMYKKENPHFLKALHLDTTPGEYAPKVKYLENLFVS